MSDALIDCELEGVPACVTVGACVDEGVLLAEDDEGWLALGDTEAVAGRVPDDVGLVVGT